MISRRSPAAKRACHCWTAARRTAPTTVRLSTRTPPTAGSGLSGQDVCPVGRDPLEVNRTAVLQRQEGRPDFSLQGRHLSRRATLQPQCRLGVNGDNDLLVLRDGELGGRSQRRTENGQLLSRTASYQVSGDRHLLPPPDGRTIQAPPPPRRTPHFANSSGQVHPAISPSSTAITRCGTAERKEGRHRVLA